MKNSIKIFSFGLILAIAGGISSLVIYKIIEKPQKVLIQQEGYPSLVNNTLDISNYTNLELAAEQTVNAVVHVKTEVMVNRSNDPFYQFFYGRQAPQMVQSAGSGVLISSDGYIVTNNHVIDDAENISITLNNKKSYDAELIGTDPTTDLALLKIDEEKLPFVPYGNSDDVRIGQWVLAVGNPFNLTSTVTAGIVSAKGRDINILSNDPYSGNSAIESFIQTDAAVNPGNSGGALVSSDGALVGINSAIKSNTGSYTGYSFAIPVNIVKKVVADLKEFGMVQRAFIGVSISNLSEDMANELDLDNLNGVYVNDAIQAGSAAKAGIKSGDVITKIGNKDIKDVTELQEQISQFRPGDKISVTVNRDSELIKIPLVLKNRKGNEDIISKDTDRVLKLLGAKFEEPSKKELQALKLKNGVRVSELYNGKLRSVGIREGFIISTINDKPIKSVDELLAIVEKAKRGVLIEGTYQNGKKEFYGFGV